jgi:uncharacterized protein (TIGR04255 family)
MVAHAKKEGGPMGGDTALGRMTNAPLAFVLAQVRFSPYLTIGQRIPAIQDALRKTYPVFRKGQIQTLELAPGSPSPNITTSERWDFLDADNREGFIIQQNFLVFLATRYERFEDFSARHAIVLKRFEEAVSDVFVEGLGLRYVDLIVPKADEAPEEYVVEGLRGCQPIDLASTGFQSRYIARWKMADGLLVFRFVNGARPPFLPPDLQLELEPADVYKRAQDANTSVGLMDFDRTLNHRGSYKASVITDLFAKMHVDTSKAFKSARSAKAESVWNSTTA